MKKLFLLVLVFIGASLSIPSLRERVAPRLRSVTASVRAAVAPPARDALEPVFRWIAVREVRSIARDLERHEAAGRRLPAPAELGEFLRRRSYSLIDGADPWGEPYVMIVRGDSIIITSSGPDLERGTADDVRGGAPRG